MMNRTSSTSSPENQHAGSSAVRLRGLTRSPLRTTLAAALVFVSVAQIKASAVDHPASEATGPLAAPKASGDFCGNGAVYYRWSTGGINGTFVRGATASIGIDPDLTYTQSGTAEDPVLTPVSLSPGGYAISSFEIFTGGGTGYTFGLGVLGDNYHVGGAGNVTQIGACVEPARYSLSIAKVITNTAASPFELGESIQYSITVTNTGNLPQAGVTVVDPAISALICTPGIPATLAPASTVVCTGSHALVAGDLTVSTYVNTATASSPQSYPVSDSATAALFKPADTTLPETTWPSETTLPPTSKPDTTLVTTTTKPGTTLVTTIATTIATTAATTTAATTTAATTTAVTTTPAVTTLSLKPVLPTNPDPVITTAAPSTIAPRTVALTTALQTTAATTVAVTTVAPITAAQVAVLGEQITAPVEMVEAQIAYTGSTVGRLALAAFGLIAAGLVLMVGRHPRRRL